MGVTRQGKILWVVSHAAGREPEHLEGHITSSSQSESKI
jgi:hypothetical protein